MTKFLEISNVWLIWLLLYCSPPIDLIGFLSNLSRFSSKLLCCLRLIILRSFCRKPHVRQNFESGVMDLSLKIGYFWRLIWNKKSYQKSEFFSPWSFLYKKYRQIFCTSTPSPRKLSPQIGTEKGSKSVFFPWTIRSWMGIVIIHVCPSLLSFCLSVAGVWFSYFPL